MIIDRHYHLPRTRQDWPKVLDISRRNGVALNMVSADLDDQRYPSAEQIRTANGEARAFVEFAWLAKRFPETTMIAAHIGGNWREGVNTVRGCGPNAHVDCCGCDPDRGMVEALVDAGGGV